MVTHPIHVKRNGYRGSDPKKRRKADDENRIAMKLESYINGLLEMQTEPIQSYMYYQIAYATGHDVETVRKFCSYIDGGANGFTAIKQGMTYEEAMAKYRM